MRHPGQVFSREDLYEMIWGLESMGDNITVAVHIGRIREKLEDDPAEAPADCLGRRLPAAHGRSLNSV